MVTYTDRERSALRSLMADLVDGASSADQACDAVRERLDLYVGDELDGRDARARQPHIWSHLLSCAACRAEHDSLLELLTAEAEGRLRPLPGRSVPVPKPVTDPWQVWFQPPEGGARPALVFVFAPAYLRRSLRPAAATAGQRLAENQPAAWDTLLLSYLGDTPAGEMMVQLYARRDAADPSSCVLTVVAAGEPMPAAAVLAWGGQECETALSPDGDGRFGPLPLAPLEAADLSAQTFSLRLLP